ncbi:glycosyltransferase [Rahnella sp. L72c]|uniref:Glycosyltransferase n=1 Tax=Rahnella perminowiae TaxID=2816244 RepID=A0ABS6L8D5_9GAMM|nr:glycosyltransferase [Rahnella perminowiae]MBU9838079.1 glycosyltransferase [Rahnella perminowiae]
MKKIEVAHLLGQLDIGGIESWLYDFVIETAGSVQHTFIIDKPHKGFYEEDLLSMGCRVIHISSYKKPLEYIAALFSVLRKNKYDVCHSHVSFNNGVVAYIAKMCGIPKVISHAHSDRTLQYQRQGLLKRLEIDFKIFLVRRYSTYCVAVSEGSARCHYKTKGTAVSIIPCGKNFQNLVSAAPSRLKQELGIAESTFVLGTVGRVEPVKNQAFLLDILSQYREQDVCLLIVGEGSLRADLHRLTLEQGLADKVILTGARDDTLLILRDVIDVFLFPSLHEGFGLAAVEAQAAGLPVIASLHVPRLIDVTERISHHSLSHLCAWTSEIDAWMAQPVRKEINTDVITGRFSIGKNAQEILRLYV